MPKMNGGEFLELFKNIFLKINRRIKIYTISASLREEDYTYSQRYSFVKDCLQKPVSRDKIADIITPYKLRLL